METGGRPSGTRPAPGTPRHPRPAPAREDRLPPSCAPSSRTTSSLRPVYTPPAARTGRRADAQFPSAAVYALPPERSAHQIAPRQPETTLERDDPDASPPDQPAHRRTPGRPEGERPARPARPRHAHAGGPGPPGAAQVVTSHHSDASGRPRPGRADADAPLARLTQTRPAGTDQPRHRPPARAQRAHRAPAPGQHPPQAQPLLPRRGRGLGRAHRARLRTPNSHAISAGHRACRPPSGDRGYPAYIRIIDGTPPCGPARVPADPAPDREFGVQHWHRT